MPPAENISPSLRQPQRKRKRGVNAEDGKETGEDERNTIKRPRKVRVEQSRDGAEGRENEGEKPRRRSARILKMNEKKGPALREVENPAKSTSRKRPAKKR
jgi:hypothetical protein